MEIDWNDGSPKEYFGNVNTCRMRKADLTSDDVKHLDLQNLNIELTHIYT